MVILDMGGYADSKVVTHWEGDKMSKKRQKDD